MPTIALQASPEDSPRLCNGSHAKGESARRFILLRVLDLNQFSRRKMTEKGGSNASTGSQ